MTRYLITGTSHIAALKLGYGLLERDDGRKVDFFGLPGMRHRHLRIKPSGRYGLLPRRRGDDVKDWRAAQEVSAKVNGFTAVELRDYDHILRVGEPSNMAAIRYVLSNFDVEGAPPRGRRNLMSDACFEAFIAELAPDPDRHGEWGAAAPATVSFLPTPLFAAASARLDDPVYRSSREFRAAQMGLRSLFDRIMDAFERRFAAAEVALFRQPAETYGDDLLTLDEYSAGSRRLTGENHPEHPKDDCEHMNPAYGALCLRRFFETCEATPPAGRMERRAATRPITEEI